MTPNRHRKPDLAGDILGWTVIIALSWLIAWKAAQCFDLPNAGELHRTTTK